MASAKFNANFTKHTIKAYKDEQFQEEVELDLYICDKFFKFEPTGNVENATFINDTNREYTNPNYVLQFYVCPFYLDAANMQGTGWYHIGFDGNIGFEYDYYNQTRYYYGGYEDSVLNGLVDNWPSNTILNPDNLTFEQGLTPSSGYADDFARFTSNTVVNLAEGSVTFGDSANFNEFSESSKYNCGLFNKKLFRPCAGGNIGQSSDGRRWVAYRTEYNNTINGNFYIAGVKKIS